MKTITKKRKPIKKTVKAWLMELPEPINRLALESNECPAVYKEVSASRALSGAFTWSRSEMGHYFWYGVYLLLQDEERSK